MQINYKLNGYSINHFSELTKIDEHNLYRYLREEQGDTKEVLKKAFIHKFGDTTNKYKSFEDYYLTKFIQIRHLRLNSSQFWELKKDFNDSAEVFKLRMSRVDSIWDKIMKHTYFQVS